MKKTISIILVVAIFLACMPFNVFAGFQSVVLPSEITDFLQVHLLGIHYELKSRFMTLITMSAHT